MAEGVKPTGMDKTLPTSTAMWRPDMGDGDGALMTNGLKSVKEETIEKSHRRDPTAVIVYATLKCQ
jgi:hypothetical protein